MHTYTYQRPSSLSVGDGLDLETSGGRALSGPAAHPHFFSGFLTRPEVAAAGLLAVAEVARTRYFQPVTVPVADPVVTGDGEHLRFESFSACCGVYARLDLLADGLDGAAPDRGTTNVDVNEPLRRALSGVLEGHPVHLRVGPDELAVTTTDGAVVERKVPLPTRWLRGFAEVQVITAGFDPRAEVSGAEAARFLRSVPKGSRSSGCLWVVPAGRSLRVSAVAGGGAVCLPGPGRLAALAGLLRHASTLRMYGPPVAAGALPVAGAWELTLPGARLTLVLSPEVRRGFSGEGQVLGALAADSTAEDADLVGALLAYEPRVDVDLLAARSGLPAARVRDALVQLGMAGRVGRDLAQAGFFHRELPYDPRLVEELNPRLGAARALVAGGAVRFEAPDGDRRIAVVSSGENVYRVRFEAGSISCSCPWYAQYRGSRGSCKHALAAEMVLREAPVSERVT